MLGTRFNRTQNGDHLGDKGERAKVAANVARLVDINKIRDAEEVRDLQVPIGAVLDGSEDLRTKVELNEHLAGDII